MILAEDYLNRMKDMLGEEYEAFLTSYDEEHYQGLRLNPLKAEISKAEADGESSASECAEGESTAAGKAVCRLPEAMKGWGLRQVPWCGNGYYYDAALRPGRHPYHLAGAYYIQEPSAMAVGELANVQPCERVLDLCGAPGGKTSHLAGQMQGRGLLWTNEIVPSRAVILSQNVERMGIANAIVSSSDPDGLALRLGSFFTTIVVDAPCSGEGMFRRDEIARDEWSLANVKMCGQRGQDILDAADRMLMSGGRLIYSTCTFAPTEDEMAVCAFIGRHPEYHIERCALKPAAGCDKADGWLSQGRNEWGDGSVDVGDTYRLWPHKLHGEGHYVAVLRKGEAVDASTLLEGLPDDTAGNRRKLDNRLKQAIKLYHEFCTDWLTGEGDIFNPSDDNRYMLFGDNLYLLPTGTPDLKGIVIERAGLQLGEIKKDRFEPGHGLAMALRPAMASVVVDIPGDSEDAMKYLKGESVSCDSSLKGWCLVTVDGFSMGWGKATSGMCKNHYPKGLRIRM